MTHPCNVPCVPAPIGCRLLPAIRCCQQFTSFDLGLIRDWVLKGRSSGSEHRWMTARSSSWSTLTPPGAPSGDERAARSDWQQVQAQAKRQERRRRRRPGDRLEELCSCDQMAIVGTLTNTIVLLIKTIASPPCTVEVKSKIKKSINLRSKI